MSASEEPKKEPIFEIKTPDDLWRTMTIARGGNPNAIQALEKFMDLNSNEERSYFPDKITTLAVAQNKMYGDVLYPNQPLNPFSLFSKAISVGFMGYKGFKSNQFVDMTRQTPNLDALTTQGDATKEGILSRFLGSGKE